MVIVEIPGDHKAIMSRDITAGFLPWWPANPYQYPLKQELVGLRIRVIAVLLPLINLYFTRAKMLFSDVI